LVEAKEVEEVEEVEEVDDGRQPVIRDR